MVGCRWHGNPIGQVTSHLSPTTLLYLPRLLIVLLSFLQGVDYDCLSLTSSASPILCSTHRFPPLPYRFPDACISRLTSDPDRLPAMLAFAFSWPVLLFSTRPFSNTLEAVALSSLLLVSMVWPTNTLTKEQHASLNQHSNMLEFFRLHPLWPTD